LHSRQPFEDKDEPRWSLRGASSNQKCSKEKGLGTPAGWQWTLLRTSLARRARENAGQLAWGNLWAEAGPGFCSTSMLCGRERLLFLSGPDSFVCKLRAFKGASSAGSYLTLSPVPPWQLNLCSVHPLAVRPTSADLYNVWCDAGDCSPASKVNPRQPVLHSAPDGLSMLIASPA
jgi:hypothetical protein